MLILFSILEWLNQYLGPLVSIFITTFFVKTLTIPTRVYRYKNKLLKKIIKENQAQYQKSTSTKLENLEKLNVVYSFSRNGSTLLSFASIVFEGVIIATFLNALHKMKDYPYLWFNVSKPDATIVAPMIYLVILLVVGCLNATKIGTRKEKWFSIAITTIISIIMFRFSLKVNVGIVIYWWYASIFNFLIQNMLLEKYIYSSFSSTYKYYIKNIYPIII